jgi:hypothetical protein
MNDDSDLFDSDSDGREMEVQDGEGLVERRIKERIVDARQRVADHRSALFVELPAERELSGRRIRLGEPKALQLWAGTVTQFLRSIEPLLRSDEIDNAEQYYRELPIVDKPVWPPDNTRTPDSEDDTRVRGPDSDYRTESMAWHRYYEDDFSPRGHQLRGPGFAPPKPKRVTLKGLKSIMETDQIVKEWTVPLNPKEPSFRQTVAYPRFESPLKRQWLEKAVAEADQFLHDSGLGLEVGSGRDYNNYSE